MKTIPSFNPADQLPVKMVLADHITSVRLGVQTMDNEQAIFEAFPDYTMFSVDGGNSYYMIYGGLIPEFVLRDVNAVPLLMDFRYTQMEQNTELTLAMEAYMDNGLRKTCTATTISNTLQQWQTVPVGENKETAPASQEELKQLTDPILNFDNVLEFNFPLEWEHAEITYNVELLTMTEGKILEYIPVELSEDGLQATYCKDETIHRLVLQLGHKFNQPGTYRIRIIWNYEDLCYADTQTTFFVNCSGQRKSASSSQEVTNDK